jgi:Transglycosylase-like domain
MTPHHPHPRRRATMSRRLARRSAVLLAALAVVAGTPPVARADAGEPAAATTRAPRAVADVAVTAQVELGPPAPEVDPFIALLTEDYTWDEQSARVEQLQEALGLVVDGRYASATYLAHRGALEFLGLPDEELPTPVLPPGPSPDAWAALRECESNGDYTITNPSGRYRGAYQFDRSTWNSVAERHAPQLVGVDPAQASPADQDAIAYALYTERGARPWPHCGRHLT